MSDTDETKRPKTLSLKKTEMSTVKQSFSHGRTKAVVVEKKRTLGAPAPAAKAEKPAAKAAAEPAPAPVAAAAAPKAAAPARGVVLRQLSDEEKTRRATALAEAKVSDAEARKHAEVEAKRRAEDDEKLKIEKAAAEKRKVEEDARKAADDIAKKRAEEVARRTETPLSTVPGEAPRRRLVNEEEEESSKRGQAGRAQDACARQEGCRRRRAPSRQAHCHPRPGGRR